MSSVSGFDDIMMTACLCIFSRSLDAHTYDNSEIDEAEGNTRSEAKKIWAQLVHFVAVQGWVQWNSNQTGHDMDTESSDGTQSDDEKGTETDEEDEDENEQDEQDEQDEQEEQ